MRRGSRLRELRLDPSYASRDSEPVALIYDTEGAALGRLHERLHRLEFSVAYARDPSAFEELREAVRDRLRAVLVPATLPKDELCRIVERAAHDAPERTPRWVVAGSRPGERVRARLRGLGVHLALWEPCDDTTLRFIVNEALCLHREVEARRAQRVCTPLIARVHSNGRWLDAPVYNLSVHGAFLEAQHLRPRGARLDLEIELPARRVRVAASVVRTNAPGNLKRRSLPVGMGVRFQAVDPAVERALAAYVEERAARSAV
ncbi:MAG: PilZ domain-containing protein [Deltaproteobacteria bacterium]|nr:MAG: PilZ domain-containing protein [Deltaproteobacteria bacterium]